MKQPNENDNINKVTKDKIKYKINLLNYRFPNSKIKYAYKIYCDVNIDAY